VLEREAWLRHRVDLGARVLHDVVPEEAGEDEIGRELLPPAPERQERLVRAVAGHAEVHDLEAGPETRREASGQARRLLDAASEDEGVPEDGDAVDARRLRLGVRTVAEAFGVRGERRLPGRPAREAGDVGLQRPAELGIPARERTARVRDLVA